MVLVIRGRCRGKKNRPRIIRNPKTKQLLVIPEAEAVAWEQSAVTQLKLQWKQPAIEVPCRLECEVWIHPQQRGDLSNYLSAVSDALERAGVVANDRLIRELDARLVVSQEPQVRARLTPLDRNSNPLHIG